MTFTSRLLAYDRSVTDGWTTVSDAEPAERMVFADLDFLDEVTHPVRGLLVRRFREPRSVAEAADALGVPVTRLYHHVNRLADRGLIRAVATRQVGARTETRYQVTARSFEIDPSFFESTDAREAAAAFGALFDFAKLDLQRQIEDGAGPRPGDGRSVLSLGQVTLTPKRHAKLVADLEAVVAAATSDAADDDPDAERMTFFLAAFSTTP